MKNNNIIPAAAAVGGLLFSGLALASFERPERVASEKVPLSQSSAVPEQVTTNMLLRQILAEVMKGNAQKADNRCSDGVKSYSPGYVISAGKKTLRCDSGKGYPEWVEDLFSYFRLRAAQQVLCASYSVPVAVLLTAMFSPFGTWSGWLFFGLFVTLMALTWGGLALYTRETDRLRHLADSPEVVVSRGKTLVGVIKQHEKAQLVWEVLQDDALIRSHLREWWRTVARFINGAFIYLPAVLLMSSWLVFWFAPEAGVMLVELLRKGAAENLVRWMAGGLTSLYVITGLLWVMVYFVMNLPVNGFREAFLAKVMVHQQSSRNEQPQGEPQDAYTPAADNAEEQEGDRK